jgi:hypothetical protein
MAQQKPENAVDHPNRIHTVDDDLARKIAESLDGSFGNVPWKCENDQLSRLGSLCRRR